MLLLILMLESTIIEVSKYSAASQLTYDEPYQTIEKIKVVGSTYMAACGLQPDGDEFNSEERSMEDNVATVAKFAAAMFEKLEKFNSESFQELQLRVGEW